MYTGTCQFLPRYPLHYGTLHELYNTRNPRVLHIRTAGSVFPIPILAILLPATSGFAIFYTVLFRVPASHNHVSLIIFKGAYQVGGLVS